MKKDLNSIIDALQDNGFMVHDDHNGGRDQRKIDFIVLQIKKNGDINVCEGFSKDKTPYFCLNPLYVNDAGEVHLSCLSCGGNIDYRYSANEDEAIGKYNREHLENKHWSQETISIIHLHKS